MKTKKKFLNYCHDNAFFGIIHNTGDSPRRNVSGFFSFGWTYENSF